MVQNICSLSSVELVVSVSLSLSLSNQAFRPEISAALRPSEERGTLAHFRPRSRVSFKMLRFNSSGILSQAFMGRNPFSGRDGGYIQGV